MSRILVINYRGANPLCVSDTVNFFQQQHKRIGISTQTLEVTTVDFQHNLDQLRDVAAIVVPGGSTFAASEHFFDCITGVPKNSYQRLLGYIAQGAHYFGICAGGYLAAANCELLSESGASYKEMFTLKLLSNVKAEGPLQPITEAEKESEHPYKRLDRKQLNIDEVQIYNAKTMPFIPKLTGYPKPIQQLYLGGPCFFPTPDLATVLFDFNKSPAIIAQKSSPSSGTIIASGLHPEATGPNSQILNAITSPSMLHRFALKEEQVASLKEQKAQEEAADMLAHAVKMAPYMDIMPSF